MKVKQEFLNEILRGCGTKEESPGTRQSVYSRVSETTINLESQRSLKVPESSGVGTNSSKPNSSKPNSR